jgi:carboxylesterase
VEFLKLLDFVKTELPKVKAPSLVIHSRRDHTITFDNLEYIASNISSSLVRTLTLENSYHVISVDEEKALIFDTIEKFIRDILKSQP